MLTRIGRHSAFLLAATLLFGSSPHLFAQGNEKSVSFGVQGSWAEDADLGLGARVILDLDKQVKGLEAVASFDYFFPGTPEDADTFGLDVDVEYLEFNLNAVYKFTLENSSFRPYTGAGLNIARAKGGVGVDLGEFGEFDFSASETEIGLNILAGVLYGKSNPKFFAEAKFEAGGGEQFVVSLGVRF